MVFRAAPLFVLVCACSNDQFNGEDAGEEKAPEDVAVVDVVPDAAPIEAEAGPTGFCSTQSSPLFCDDFDELPKATDSWSVTTPASPPAGALDFGPGVSGKGAAVKAPGATNVYLTEQLQGKTLHGFTFALQLSGPIGTTTYVRLQAGSSTFTLAVDLTAANLTVTGDSGGAVTIGKADSAWHTFDVQLNTGKAIVTMDGKSAGNVPFAASTAQSSQFDIGVIASTLNVVGITANVDNVALR